MSRQPLSIRLAGLPCPLKAEATARSDRLIRNPAQPVPLTTGTNLEKITYAQSLTPTHLFYDTSWIKLPNALLSLPQLEATVRSDRPIRSRARPAPTTTSPVRPTRPTAPTAPPASTVPEPATLPPPVAATRGFTAREVLARPPKMSWRLATTPPWGQVSSIRVCLGRITTRQVVCPRRKLFAGLE